MKIVYTGPALVDLDRLKQWIAVHNPNAARRMVTRLKQNVLQLAQFPLLGVALEENPAIRDLIVDNYIVRYRLDTVKTFIYILKIWHGRENERSFQPDMQN